MTRKKNRSQLRQKIEDCLKEEKELKQNELRDKLWNEYGANTLYDNKQVLAVTLSQIRNSMVEQEVVEVEEVNPDSGSIKTWEWRLK